MHYFSNTVLKAFFIPDGASYRVMLIYSCLGRVWSWSQSFEMTKLRWYLFTTSSLLLPGDTALHLQKFYILSAAAFIFPLDGRRPLIVRREESLEEWILCLLWSVLYFPAEFHFFTRFLRFFLVWNRLLLTFFIKDILRRKHSHPPAASVEEALQWWKHDSVWHLSGRHNPKVKQTFLDFFRNPSFQHILLYKPDVAQRVLLHLLYHVFSTFISVLSRSRNSLRCGF